MESEYMEYIIEKMLPAVDDFYQKTFCENIKRCYQYYGIRPIRGAEWLFNKLQSQCSFSDIHHDLHNQFEEGIVSIILNIIGPIHYRSRYFSRYERLIQHQVSKESDNAVLQSEFLAGALLGDLEQNLSYQDVFAVFSLLPFDTSKVKPLALLKARDLSPKGEDFYQYCQQEISQKEPVKRLHYFH